MSSSQKITTAVMTLCDQILAPALSVRRINVTANHVQPESAVTRTPVCNQLDLFADCSAQAASQEAEEQSLAREKKRQQALLTIQKKYGKNAILKGCDLQDGAMAISRNNQIGGHKA